jgi:transposase-like protein
MPSRTEERYKRDEVIRLVGIHIRRGETLSAHARLHGVTVSVQERGRTGEAREL